MSALAVLFAFVAVAPQGSQNYALTENSAYLLLPARFVCAAEEAHFKWSPDGKRLIVMRSNSNVTPEMMRGALSGKKIDPSSVKPTVDVMVWSSPSGTTRKAYSFNPHELEVSELSWLPGTPYALFSISTGPEAAESNQELMSVNAATGVVTRVFRAAPGEDIDWSVSHKKPLGYVIVRRAEGPAALRLIRPNLQLSRAYALETITDQLTWSPDGGGLLQLRHEQNPKTEDVTLAWTRFNEATGVFERTKEPEVFVQRPELRLRSRTVDFELSSERAGAKSILLEPYQDDAPVRSGTKATAPKPAPELVSAVVTTDGESGVLAPTQDGVAYLHQGNALVRPILKLPKEAFVQAQNEAKKAVAISNAKQAGLGMLMYSGDYDEVFPPNSGDWQEAVHPYVKNLSILKGFNYTFQGGPLDPNASPARVELGFVLGPGGRAVVYADGHVEWVPDAF